MTVANITAGSFTYAYDANGNLIQETYPLADPIYEYDARNRLISVTGMDPDGEGELEAPVTSYTFDLAGNMTSVTDPLGQTTEYEYDAQGRVISVTGPDPDGEGGLEAPVTSYTFDLAGRQTSITDPAGNVTGYEYDDANRLITVIDPLENETHYEYDAANQVVSITDRNGRERTFDYNYLGLVTSEVWLDKRFDQPHCLRTPRSYLALTTEGIAVCQFGSPARFVAMFRCTFHCIAKGMTPFASNETQPPSKASLAGHGSG